ncbi:MAG: hypothetical protein GEU94_21545, partial [Micromonosporaceae bacterium]|nr:hypothetical protein [Micromonosporaceae bacterium]
MSSDAQQALARGAALTGHFRVLGAPAVGSALAAGSVRDASPSWVRLRDTATPAGLERTIAQVRRAAPGCSETVAAALFASSVAGALAAPITGALLAERRAALPDAGQTWLRPAFTGVDAIATGQATLTVLPGDLLANRPAARASPDVDCGPDVDSSPDVVAVPDLDRLRVTVLDGYRALLVPLLDLVAATTRRGRRALWADAGDRLATYLLLAGR